VKPCITATPYLRCDGDHKSALSCGNHHKKRMGSESGYSCLIILWVDKDCSRHIGIVDQLEAAFTAGLTCLCVRSVVGICGERLDCFNGGKLQKGYKGGIQRLAFQGSSRSRSVIGTSIFPSVFNGSPNLPDACDMRHLFHERHSLAPCHGGTSALNAPPEFRSHSCRR